MLFQYDDNKYVNTDHIVKVVLDVNGNVRISTVMRDDSFPIIVGFDKQADAITFIEELKWQMK